MRQIADLTCRLNEQPVVRLEKEDARPKELGGTCSFQNADGQKLLCGQATCATVRTVANVNQQKSLPSLRTLIDRAVENDPITRRDAAIMYARWGVKPFPKKRRLMVHKPSH